MGREVRGRPRTEGFRDRRGAEGASGVRGAQHPEMAPARDLDRVGRSRAPAALLPVLGTGRLTDGVGERFQVVTTGAGGGRGVGEPDDFPAARRGEPLAVLGTEVVAVGLGIGGERAEDRGRVGIDVRQCRDGGTAARGSRTATYRAHDVGRYRTLERAATTVRQLTPSCRPVDRAPHGSGAARPTCTAAGARGPGPVRRGEQERSHDGGPAIGARTGTARNRGRNVHPGTSRRARREAVIAPRPRRVTLRR